MLNLAERMRMAVPAPEFGLLQSVGRAADANGVRAYAVGGLPRDLLLGHSTGDFDIVIEGDAIAIGKQLAATQGGSLLVHPRFGTAHWDTPLAGSGAVGKVGSRGVDFVRARLETYSSPGTLPRVQWGMLEDDLRRRDFTVNCLAVSLNLASFGELFDPCGGLADLEARSLRVLHRGSFSDDPTRLFRGARYEVRFGFRMVRSTVRLVVGALPHLSAVSGHRIRHELDLILSEGRAGDALRRLQRLGVLGAVHPALTLGNIQALRKLASRAQFRQQVPAVSGMTLGWLVWLGALDHAALRGARARLHWSRQLAMELIACSSMHRFSAGLWTRGPAAVVRQVEDLPLAAMAAVGISSADAQARRSILDYLETWRHMRPHLTGHDLRAMGVHPGPEMGRILRQLRKACLEGRITAAAEERQLVARLISQHVAAKP